MSLDEEIHAIATDVLSEWLPSYTDPLGDGKQRALRIRSVIDGVITVDAFIGDLYEDHEAIFELRVIPRRLPMDNQECSDSCGLHVDHDGPCLPR